MMLELPLSGDPAQEWVTALDRVKYLFRVQLNTRSDSWTLDINTEQDVPLSLGIPLVLGADLLANYRVMAGMLFLVDYTGTGDDPTGDNLDQYGLVLGGGLR
jgi:hypothetical protein